ncbi:MAG: pilin [Candidatus Uhrbacteria bacterium]|nr:pilin [Candidatus Uhrbacteria bacterium]
MKNKKNTYHFIQKIFAVFVVFFSLFSSSVVFADEVLDCTNAGGSYSLDALSGAYASPKTCSDYCRAEEGTERLKAMSGTNCCCGRAATSSSSGGSRAVTPGVATPVADPPGIAKFDNPLGTQVDIPLIAGDIIKKALGIIGSVALVIFLYGGIQWMIATGDDTRVKKGLDTMIWAGLGLVIIFGSYVAVQFLLTAVLGS